MFVPKSRRMAICFLLEEFLVTRDCYSQFIENMEFYRGHTSLPELINECIDDEGADVFVDKLVGYAFCWSDTAEGIVYWFEMAKAWKKCYKLGRADLPPAREKTDFNSIW